MPHCFLRLPDAKVGGSCTLPVRRRQPGLCLVWLALAVTSFSSHPLAAPTPFAQADPTAEEQFLLQKLNRARLDPVGEGQRLADWLRNTADGQSVVAQYGTNPDQVQADFAALPAVSPLTFDVNLHAAALAHVNDLTAHNGVAPNGDPHAGYDGSTPSTRDQAAGFTQSSAGENVAIDFGSLDLIHAGYLVDWGNPGLGHRKISMSGSNGVNVVGIASTVESSDAPLIETEDYGFPRPVFNGNTLVLPDSPATLTGVVFRDANGNAQYDVGEGVAGATVTMENGSYYATTSASGGYALPLVTAGGVNADGNVTVHVQFSDGSRVSKTVAITRLDSQLGSYRSNVEWEVTATATALPAFFDGAAILPQSWNYLAFAGGNLFGYYNAGQFPFIYHNDLGWEYAQDAQDGQAGVYLYDFQSGAWWYTSPGFAFPYLYDFSRRTVLYYYPADGLSGHYTSGPRWFYDFGAGKIITL